MQCRCMFARSTSGVAVAHLAMCPVHGMLQCLLLLVLLTAPALAQDCGGFRDPPCENPDGSIFCTFVPSGGGRSAPNGANLCVPCGSGGRPPCLSAPSSAAWNAHAAESQARCFAALAPEISAQVRPIQFQPCPGTDKGGCGCSGPDLRPWVDARHEQCRQSRVCKLRQ